MYFLKSGPKRRNCIFSIPIDKSIAISSHPITFFSQLNSKRVLDLKNIKKREETIKAPPTTPIKRKYFKFLLYSFS